MYGRKRKAKPPVKTSITPEAITIESTNVGEVSRCEDAAPLTQEKMEEPDKEQDEELACSD